MRSYSAAVYKRSVPATATAWRPLIPPMKKALSAFWRRVTFRRNRRASSETWTLVECVSSSLGGTAYQELWEQGDK
jgi:hypothetical protein